MQHTKGPWTIFKGYIVQANEDGSVPLNTKWICQVEYFGPDSTEANAHLIAASPELLIACQFALEWLEAFQAETSEPCDYLKKAIAKATGGNQ